MTKTFMLDPLASNSMRSSNPRSGFHEIAAWPTLDTLNPSPTKNAGGGVVIQSRCRPDTPSATGKDTTNGNARTR